MSVKGGGRLSSSAEWCSCGGADACLAPYLQWSTLSLAESWPRLDRVAVLVYDCYCVKQLIRSMAE